MDALFHPMETAVSDGNTALFIELLNQPEYRSQLSSTMLGHDCHEVDPNERDFQGRTPLFFAAMEGSCKVISRLLVIHNIDPDAQDHGGKTPFYWAIFYGHSSAALHLRDTGLVNDSIISRAYEDREAVLEAGLPLAFARNS